MDRSELRDLLESHSTTLRQRGFDVRSLQVGPPATVAEVAALEEALGLVLPESFRAGLREVSSTVDWYWQAEEPFPPPFDDNFSGHLHWSVQTLVEVQQGYRAWIDACFSNADDPYDAVWQHKLAFLPVPNGDQIAVDLDPAHSGEVAYLSHDGGEGHGYVLAESLSDLVDRWVPLGCPGAEDWQWLPFVPYDEGPIDPTTTDARTWQELLGLRAQTARTPPVQPPRVHIDALLATYRSSPGSPEGAYAGRRALKCCSPDRIDDVLDLLGSENSRIQEVAANVLGKWQRSDAVPGLAAAARSGTHNGRIAAMLALSRTPGLEADAALAALREETNESWHPYLRRPNDH